MNPDKPTPRRGVPTQELRPVLAEQQNEDPGHLPPIDDQSEGIVKRWVSIVERWKTLYATPLPSSRRRPTAC